MNHDRTHRGSGEDVEFRAVMAEYVKQAVRTNSAAGCGIGRHAVDGRLREKPAAGALPVASVGDHAGKGRVLEGKAAIAAMPLPGGAPRQALLDWCDRLRDARLLDVQAAYVAQFDRGRATSLLLFEHVHGESRDRGGAMVSLLETYRAVTSALLGQVYKFILEWKGCSF